MPKRFAIRLDELELFVIREALTGYQPRTHDEDAAPDRLLEAARDGLLEELPGGEG